MLFDTIEGKWTVIVCRVNHYFIFRNSRGCQVQICCSQKPQWLSLTCVPGTTLRGLCELSRWWTTAATWTAAIGTALSLSLLSCVVRWFLWQKGTKPWQKNTVHVCVDACLTIRKSTSSICLQKIGHLSFCRSWLRRAAI
jgi:hypothetical protein